MTNALYVAAVLTLLLGLAHSYLGERYILIRLFRQGNLPHLLGGEAFTRHTLRFAWHLLTVAWFGFAGLLLHAVSDGSGARTRVHVMSLMYAASGAVTLVGSRGRHLAWVVLFVIAGLTWFAFS
jgi:hypothetical protein